MPVLAVTYVRLESITWLPRFLSYTIPAIAAAHRADGFRRMLPPPSNVGVYAWMTITLWDNMDAMKQVSERVVGEGGDANLGGAANSPAVRHFGKNTMTARESP